MDKRPFEPPVIREEGSLTGETLALVSAQAS
jgi:hypothetical protein